LVIIRFHNTNMNKEIEGIDNQAVTQDKERQCPICGVDEGMGNCQACIRIQTEKLRQDSLEKSRKNKKESRADLEPPHNIGNFELRP
jgi:hypothetical protein